MEPTKICIQHRKKLNSNTKPIVVLMGRTGTGKTTLFNKICGTNRTAEAGSSSVTRDLCLHDVNCGDNPFSVIDTPGNNSKQEAYKHAVLLRAALTVKKVNCVFMIMSFENRFDLMVEYFLEQQELLYKYDHKIILMISHWDLSKNPE